MKITEGQWVVTHNSWDMSTVHTPDGEVIARCPISHYVTEDSQVEFETLKEGNARLICAAQKLLKALQGAIAVAKAGFVASSLSVDEWREAIAEATGDAS